MKYKKRFMVALILLTIFAIGAASASEDISDDTVSAIEPTDEAISQAVEETEPTDEAISQAVEETEPTDEAISQAVEETEPTEEVISESVEDIESEKSVDSNEELTDIEDEFRVYFYNTTLNNEVIYIHSSSNKNGIMKIYVDNQLKNTTSLVNGKWNRWGNYDNYFYVSPTNLGIGEIGTYAINITFIENGAQTETVVKTGKITISEFRVSFNEGFESVREDIIYINSGSDRTGTINIYVDGKVKANYTLTNGKFYVSEYSYTTQSMSIYPSSIGIDRIGLYNIRVTFIDNETQTEETLQEKNVPYIICYVNDEYEHMAADENLEYVVNFPGLNSGTVEIYEYSNYTKTEKIGSGKIVNGMATVKLSGLSPKYHNILIEYSTEFGTGNQTWGIYVMKNVGKVAVSIPTEITEGTNAVITVNANQTGRLSISVDGKTMLCNVSSLKYIIPDLAAGTHNVRVAFFGNYVGYDEETGLSIYDLAYMKSYKLTVKGKVIISASKVSATYNSAAKTLSVTLKDANKKVLAKKAITVTLNGKTYKATTNAKGIATIKVPTKLAPKTYTATIKFAGDAKYAAASLKAKVVVNKAKAKLTAAKKTFKVKATKKFKATLKNNKGKVMKKVKLTLKIGKKTYTAKTNAKGIATFKVKLTKKGTYSATVKFAGNKYFKAASKKVKITVK